MPSRKRVLITGGAGMLGSNLAIRLISDGCEVEILDNFYTGFRENVVWVQGKTGAHVHVWEQDVGATDHSFQNALLGLARYDEVYHLACPASPPHYQKDPLFTFRTCVNGTQAVLQAAEGTNVKVMIASTSEVYGNPTVHPQNEEYWGNVNSFGVRSVYDEGKRASETLAYEFLRRGVDIRIARIFNSYGPRMDPKDGRLVSNFSMQALRGEPMTIYGNGEQTRSICYAEDTVDGFVKLMASDEKRPVNIGNPIEMRVIDIARMIWEIVSEEQPRYEFHPLPSDDPLQRCPDISRAVESIGWRPQWLPEDGLRRTVAYFRSLL